jgi:hypothetical protein
MALIQCGECAQQVSDKAPACPRCGAPVAAGEARPVVTTQQTAKRYKGMQLWGAVILCIGVVMMMAGGNSAVWGLLVGLAGCGLYAVGRFRAWWNHG